MKKNIICIIIVIIGLVSCTSKSSDDYLKEFVSNDLKRIYKNNIAIFEIKILSKESFIKSNSNDKKLLPVKVYTHYVFQGLVGGYIQECPTAQCYNDIETERTITYFMCKNNNNEWEIESNSVVDTKDINSYWRSTETKIDDYYKDKIQK